MKKHYDKFLSGSVYCGRQDYDSATDNPKEVTCKDCIRIINSLKNFDWKKEIRKLLKIAYGDRVSIVYDKKNNPTLIFKDDDVSINFKSQVVRNVEHIFDTYGGKVKFFFNKEQLVQ